MADIIDSLIGEQPPGAGDVAALASELRRRRAFGELGILSGDKTLQSFGANMLNNDRADEFNLGSRQDKAKDDRRQDSQFSNLMAHQSAQLDQQMTIAKMQDQRMRELETQQEEAGKYDKAWRDGQIQSQKTQQQTDKETQALAAKLTASKVPQVSASIKTLNDTLSGFDKPDNVPGMGYLKNFPGASMFLTDKGKMVKSQAQAVANDLLSMYSGLAVTVPEEERRKLEMMSSGSFSAKDFQAAWPEVITRYNSIKNGILGGWRPEIRQNYVDNVAGGGFDLKDFVPQDPLSRASRNAPVVAPKGPLGGAVGALRPSRGPGFDSPPEAPSSAGSVSTGGSHVAVIHQGGKFYLIGPDGKKTEITE